MSDPDATLNGGCLCGQVRYHYEGELGGSSGAITQCHCNQCRKAQGGPASVGPGSAAKFSVVDGASLIREYELSPGKFRAFCERCGSPLYSRRVEHPDAIRLRLGSLDAPPPDLHIEAHIFCADRAPWDNSAEAPEYAGSEPGR